MSDPLFKPPFRVERTKMSSGCVLDSNGKLVVHLDSGQAKFYLILEEICCAMNQKYEAARASLQEST